MSRGPKPKQWMSYEEAQAWAMSQGFRSQKDWHSRRKAMVEAGNWPVGVPSNPHETYGDLFVTNGGWKAFLGEARRWMPYTAAKAWAMAQGFRSMKDWQERCKAMVEDGQWPTRIPRTPWATYGSHFKQDGVDGFLGIHRVKLTAVERGWMPYAEAKAWVQAQHFASAKDMYGRRKAMVEAQNWPIGIPCNPDVIYAEEFKQDGFVGFLGLPTSKRQRGFQRSTGATYEDAKAWAISQGIRSGTEWAKRRKALLATGEWPSNVPACPNQVYAEHFKDGGWKAFLTPSSP